MSAKAVEDTNIIRLPAKVFVDMFQKFPESLVQITQIIMLRLQRVTFTALHSYLGLTSEIMKIEKKKSPEPHHHHHHQRNQRSKKNEKKTKDIDTNSEI